MKSCRWNGGAAYSRPVLALAGTARKVALDIGEATDGTVGPLHRFALILCASLCFALASCGSVDATPSAHPQTPAAQVRAASRLLTDFAFGIETAERTRTEQYTLSHERQAKA